MFPCLIPCGSFVLKLRIFVVDSLPIPVCSKVGGVLLLLFLLNVPPQADWEVH